MNTIAALALLAGSNFSSTCIMTQTQGGQNADRLQGYTIESFQFGNKTDAKSLDVKFVRTWYADENCTELKTETTESGSVSIGNAMQSMGFGNTSESTLEADWNLNGKKSLGAIAIAQDEKSIRTVTSSFGSSRNTMLSLTRYSRK